jgi:4-amino-4-deoxy-L-arabinose transferase-like glycosyltransferase
MIGRLLTIFAGRSIARTVGGAAAGPAGAAMGAVLPVVIPAVARRLGPGGMLFAALFTAGFARWLKRRNEARHQALEATGGAPSARRADALLGAPPKPRRLEGELKR